MIIIYRKSDLTCVGVVPSNMTSEQEIALNVIPNFGGTVNDYDGIETDLQYFELARKNGVVKVVKKTEHPVIPVPTLEERLEIAENTILGLLDIILMGGM